MFGRGNRPYGYILGRRGNLLKAYKGATKVGQKPLKSEITLKSSFVHSDIQFALLLNSEFYGSASQVEHHVI